MREMLFRGKRIDSGEWVEGNFYESQISGCYILENKLLATVGGRHSRATIRDKLIPYEVDPITVGQYTGLKDKNGKRIFEGDIVKAQDDLIFSPFCDGLVGKVVYIETAFFIEPKDPAKSEYLFNECAVYEVLGNIHDNGELMEDA